MPHHFSRINGTSAATDQHFNDKNVEEESRYVNLSACDYLVATMDQHSLADSAATEKKGTNTWREKVGQFIQEKMNYGDETEDGEVTKSDFSILDVDSEPIKFQLLFSRRIIDAARSSSSIARAYFIPGYSSVKNAYSSYSALKRE